MVVFALSMLLAAGLSLRAVRSGELERRQQDPHRLRQTLPPVIVSLVSLVVFPWSAII
jgi:hypothetical protein